MKNAVNGRGVVGGKVGREIYAWRMRKVIMRENGVWKG